MNRQIIATLLAVFILLTFSACRKAAEDIVENEPTDAMVIETYPGLVYNPEGDDGNLGDADINVETTDETAETKEAVKSNMASMETDASEKKDVAEEIEATENKDVSEENETEATQETTVLTPPSVENTSPTESQITDYEWFEALSADEQAAFVNSFSSAIAFIEWYDNAEADYVALHPVIELNGESISAEDLLEVLE